MTETDFGTSYGAYRPAEDDSYYWRIAHFLFPFYTMIPTGVMGAEVRSAPGCRWTTTTRCGLSSSRRAPPTRWRPTARASKPAPHLRTATGRPLEYRDDDTSWLGRWRLAANVGNDYHIDREAQGNRTSYTGIPGGALQQDKAVTESMGTIYDRSHEHLGTSDSMVIRTRRRLINAARAFAEQGVMPPGVDNTEMYLTRSGGVILPNEVDWLEATASLRKAFVEHKADELVTVTR